MVSLLREARADASDLPDHARSAHVITTLLEARGHASRKEEMLFALFWKITDLGLPGQC